MNLSPANLGDVSWKALFADLANRQQIWQDGPKWLVDKTDKMDSKKPWKSAAKY
jgi:hypothetical protein